VVGSWYERLNAKRRPRDSAGSRTVASSKLSSLRWLTAVLTIRRRRVRAPWTGNRKPTMSPLAAPLRPRRILRTRCEKFAPPTTIRFSSLMWRGRSRGLPWSPATTLPRMCRYCSYFRRFWSRFHWPWRLNSGAPQRFRGNRQVKRRHLCGIETVVARGMWLRCYKARGSRRLG